MTNQKFIIRPHFRLQEWVAEESALADFAMYVAVLAAIGPVPLAVTINLNVNFLRKPTRRDLTAEARLLKLGQRLATGEVAIRCAGDEKPVAHVTATYSIPPH